MNFKKIVNKGKVRENFEFYKLARYQKKLHLYLQRKVLSFLRYRCLLYDFALRESAF